MDLGEQAVHNMQDLAEAWVAASTDTSFRRAQIVSQQETVNPSTSFSEDPSASDANRDVIVVSPTPEDPMAPSVSSHCQGPANMTPVVPTSRKRKQASPQPCREAADVIGGPSLAKTPAKEKLSLDSKHGKMLPVHCSIESADLPPGKEKEGIVEGYAIVPSTLLLKELVRVAMIKLDCPKDQIRSATGVIQVQNWKALPFTQITDDPQATVGQILGDLLSYITLKIRIGNSHSAHLRPTSSASNPTPSTLQPSLLGFPLKRSVAAETLGSRGAQEIRLKLLQLLEKRGPTMLVSHGCPFSQGTVLAIIQGKYTKPIQQEKLQSFYQWYNIYNGLMDNTLIAAEKLDSTLPVKPSSRHWRRPRTLFDQRYELPRLMSWYRMNPRPSRAELEIYLAELNSSERRRNSHPLQYSSIAIWFKNARAKYRGIRGLSPDSPEFDRTSRISKGQVGRISEIGERRRESTNGPRQAYIPFAHPKVKSENRSRFTNQNRSSQKSEPPPRVDHRDLAGLRTSLSNGLAHTNTHSTTLLSTPDVSSLRALPKPVSSSGMEQVVNAPSSSATTPSQVTDIRKIASGFGIMLSPSVQDVHSERKVIPVENIKVEEPSPSSTVTTSSHDTSAALNLSSSKPASSSANPSPATLVVPSISMTPTVTMAPIRVPTTTMVHNSMSNGPVTAPKHSSRVDSQQALSIPQQSNSSKTVANRPTRKRFNIHPNLEVPKLQAWFCVNPKPDRHTIDQFVAELNRTEFRKDQPKYDSRIVYVWFKNARAKYSRQKIREGEELGADTSNLTLTYSRVIQL